MNKVLLEGRLTRDPDIRYTQSDDPVCISRYTLAVTKGYYARKKDADDNADFVPCIAYGKQAEFVKKFLKKGSAIAICGKIQTSSYTSKEGKKVYVTEVVAEEHSFAEKKNARASGTDSSLGEVKDTSRQTFPEAPAQADVTDSFTDLPEDEYDVLPFS
jgi:single-strand DNA-binding protein